MLTCVPALFLLVLNEDFLLLKKSAPSELAINGSQSASTVCNMHVTLSINSLSSPPRFASLKKKKKRDHAKTDKRIKWIFLPIITHSRLIVTQFATHWASAVLSRKPFHSQSLSHTSLHLREWSIVSRCRSRSLRKTNLCWTTFSFSTQCKCYQVKRLPLFSMFTNRFRQRCYQRIWGDQWRW